MCVTVPEHVQVLAQSVGAFTLLALVISSGFAIVRSSIPGVMRDSQSAVKNTIEKVVQATET